MDRRFHHDAVIARVVEHTVNPLDRLALVEGVIDAQSIGSLARLHNLASQAPPQASSTEAAKYPRSILERLLHFISFWLFPLAFPAKSATNCRSGAAK